MSEEKTIGEQKREALLYNRKNGYDRISAEEKAELETYCEGYKRFLNEGKTEREAVTAAIAIAEDHGYVPFVRGMALKAGDKVYWNNRGKSLMLARIGETGLAQGVNIGAAHIDSPRLDLRPNPLYEASELALFKTHYYGGIRKYQWVTIPLELRGVVTLKSGKTLRVNIGAEKGDPIFCITDLLPHLADKQAQKPLHNAIAGEDLNLLLGSEPFPGDEGKDRVKLQVMCLLNEKYGIVEEDFISAEIEVVPAFQASDVGLDRSLIGGYGQDDRVCAYAALLGLMNAEHVNKTAICVLADKEEIGSTGISGMKSRAFETFLSDLCKSQGADRNECFENSFCLSADVTAAFDPTYPDPFEKNNSAYVNYGMGFSKYTGSRGKSGANDASAEVVGYARRVMDKAGVVWQMAELGKVDAGGGGTVACFMADRNIPTLDAGVPVLSMHAPFEVTGKLDCYMTYRGMKAVFEA